MPKKKTTRKASTKKTTRKTTKKAVKKTKRKTPTKSKPVSSPEIPAWTSAQHKPVLPSNPDDLEDGFHYNVPDDYYRRINAVSNSAMNGAMRSMAHYRYSPPVEETKSLLLGSYVHHNKLEPELVDRTYVVIPEKEIEEDMRTSGDHLKETKKGVFEPYKNLKATANYKARVTSFLQNHPGKTPVSEEWFNNVQGMLTKLNSHERANQLFQNGDPEVVMLWTDPTTGLRCKAKVDFIQRDHDTLVDLKTTDDASTWSLDKWGYHRQAAHYCTGYSLLRFNKYPHEIVDRLDPKPTFHFVVVEKKEPWGVMAAPIDEDSFDIGYAQVTDILADIRTCVDAKQWPGYADPESWKVSPWYARDYYADYSKTATK